MAFRIDKKVFVYILFTMITAFSFPVTCYSTEPMEVPIVKKSSPIDIDPNQELASIGFEKGIASLRRGDAIAHFPKRGYFGDRKFIGAGCNLNYPRDARILWGSGSKFLGGWDDELGELFYDTMRDIGYNVVGDPTELFNAGSSRESADYLIAAKITKIASNMCERVNAWTWAKMDVYIGEMYQEIEWTVYSPRYRETIGKIKTEVYTRQDQDVRDGFMQLFHSAFIASAEELAANPKFYALVSKSYEGPQSQDLPMIKIPQVNLSEERIEERQKQIIESTVTIRRGKSHGSGFVISSDGHILTNHHVVSSAKEVLVVFNSGMQVPGKVIRTTKVRDIALVQIPIRGLKPLPIDNTDELFRMDTVYAVGTPIKEELSATITKGIVSAIRTSQKDDLTYIQSDVDIAGGSSGGPLLNSNGNVVAIAVAGYGVAQMSSGLNLFIPVKDALKHLNMVLVKD